MSEFENDDGFKSLYEKAQQRFEQTGLNVFFEAFLPKQCRHIGRRSIATQIVIEFDEAAQEEVVFEVKDIKCLDCGKSVQLDHKRLFYSQNEIQSLRATINGRRI